MGPGQFHPPGAGEHRPCDLKLKKLWFMDPGKTGYRLDERIEGVSPAQSGRIRTRHCLKRVLKEREVIVTERGRSIVRLPPPPKPRRAAIAPPGRWGVVNCRILGYPGVQEARLRGAVNGPGSGEGKPHADSRRS